MSPKKITRMAFIVGGISIVGLIATIIARPEWSWGPGLGLGLAVLLLITSFLRGAYLAAQRRVAMVDKLNDCYSGVPVSSEEAGQSEARLR